MSVKRYRFIDILGDDDSREYVDYEDYAAKCLDLEHCQEREAALEAENKRLRDTMKTVSRCDACPVCAELADGHLYRLVTADQAGG